jgi:ferrochelatase
MMMSYFVSVRLVLVSGILSIAAISSATKSFAAAAESNFSSGKKVGVLFSSFGDVDRPDEIESFVKNTLRDPDVAPIPRLMRPFVAEWAWMKSKKDIVAEYAAIGNATHFRTNSALQAEAVAGELRKKGFYAKGYHGFTMVNPFLFDALSQARRDGVEELVVFYQGAQWSKPTSFIVYRETKRYLAAHPEWKVRATMVRSFSDDARFQKLIGDGIESRLNSEFAGLSPSDVCIVLPAHGNPTLYNDQGDPAYDQMLRVFRYVQKRFSAHPVFYGFQNHSELPGSRWTQPEMSAVIRGVGENSCQNVLINGRTSFTVDSLETLYDHGIKEVEELHGIAPQKRVYVEKMFNADEEFARLLASLAGEALRGEGDISGL